MKQWIFLWVPYQNWDTVMLYNSLLYITLLQLRIYHKINIKIQIYTQFSSHFISFHLRRIFRITLQDIYKLTSDFHDFNKH